MIAVIRDSFRARREEAPASRRRRCSTVPPKIIPASAVDDQLLPGAGSGLPTSKANRGYSGRPFTGRDDALKDLVAGGRRWPMPAGVCDTIGAAEAGRAL